MTSTAKQRDMYRRMSAVEEGDPSWLQERDDVIEELMWRSTDGTHSGWCNMLDELADNDSAYFAAVSTFEKWARALREKMHPEDGADEHELMLSGLAYYAGTMIAAAEAEDLWRAAIGARQSSDITDKYGIEARRRSLIQHEAALGIWGEDCDECDESGDVLFKVIAATLHGPQESRYIPCDRCRGTKRFLRLGTY